VIVQRFDRENLSGFVQTDTWLTGGELELLAPEGTLIRVPLAQIKKIFFVREFDEALPERNRFLARPKIKGLWVRLSFRDGDELEGVLPNNLLLLDSAGFPVIPPDYAYATQRVFIPRTAVTEVQVLGVIGSPKKPDARRRTPALGEKRQIALFE
jgi:hypothetical protein